jgi:hypothetical protein
MAKIHSLKASSTVPFWAVTVGAVNVHFAQLRRSGQVLDVDEALAQSLEVLRACQLCRLCAAGHAHHDGQNGAGEMVWDLHVVPTPDEAGVYLFECEAVEVWRALASAGRSTR